ncbi:unnamed protein product, partial [Didymodactylos carnosus]
SIISGHYEAIVANYSLHRTRLIELLNNLPIMDNENITNTIEKVYRDCLYYQMQMNMARKNIQKCRQLLKQNVNDDEYIEQPEKKNISSDYIRVLVDLITNALASLSAVLQQNQNSKLLLTSNSTQR